MTAAQDFVLRAAPPVRALAIAAGAALVAIVLLAVAFSGRASTALTVVAVVLLVLGLALGLGAIVLTGRLRASVRVDDREISVRKGRRGRRTESVAWSEVGEVTLEGARLRLVAQDGTGLVLVNPRTPGDPTFVGLLRAIRQRLDRSRGYGGRPF